MLNNLIKKLARIEDFRKDKGKRHQLTIVIIIMIIGNMLGFMSYRALGINNQELIEQFNQWGEELMNSDEIGDYFAIDGKSLRNTVTDVFSYEEIVYYISSKLETATEVAKKIRNHWGIENKLHWVKDVVMEEDKI
jgi:flagellar basal body-associated protein FliL